MPLPPDEIRPSGSLAGALHEAFRRVRARRPTSFYLLLAIPVVMVLGIPLFQWREDPKRFAFMLGLQFIFLGIILLRAVFDVFEIALRGWREQSENFKETLGDDAFVRELAERVKREPKE